MQRLLAILLSLLLAVPVYAGREFDGTDDEIEFGSDTSIDNATTRSYAFWVRWDGSGAIQMLMTKAPVATEAITTRSGNVVRVSSDWTTDGSWDSTTTINGAQYQHVCAIYNHGATANDPTIIINGNTETLSVDIAPTGSWVADAANNLQLGEANNDAVDFDGQMGWVIYHTAALNAGSCNRARWWGRPGGGMAVYHPFVTDKLANEGTATANGTATGTTVAFSPVPVVRPGSALLNGGIGW